MKKIKILNVVGARPNFMKIAPIMMQMQKIRAFRPILVHTGQHYDKAMSDLFFRDLHLPNPDIYLGIGGGSHAEQTGRIMISIEKVLIKESPEIVMVVGDVNSTLAASIVSSKLGIPVAHVEAGLRSYDMSMPEEINRIITDRLSRYLFTTCRDAGRNLAREGIDKSRVYFTGNVMIDTLKMLMPAVRMNKKALDSYGLSPGCYGLVTLHRPSNVDEKDALENILAALKEISRKLKIVFPMHPRTEKKLRKFGLSRYLKEPDILITGPLGYMDFMSLMTGAKLVMTDSGGIQEETTVLGIPCITMRFNTERPITVEQGTNILVGNDRRKIVAETNRIIRGGGRTGRIPALWDGKSAKRIVEVLKRELDV